MAFVRRQPAAGLSWKLFALQVALLSLVAVVQSQSSSAPPPDQTAEPTCNRPKESTSNTATIATAETTDDNMAAEVDYKTATSIYDFTVKDSFGNDVSLEKYRGKVVLITNIASNCGLTKNNYAKLTQLQKQFDGKDFGLLSFPCNQFASQMPEADGEEMVCHLRSAQADVGDVYKKVNVNGDAASPLWKYLKHKQGGLLGFDGIKWNFTKFLVDKNGQVVGRFGPTTDPMDIAAKIEALM